MLNDNIKNLRKNKGFTQEELANKLNVVRQTVSKWEKGYSVPDAEMLKKIAETLDTDVSQLLGSAIEKDTNIDSVAEQLSRINEQLVIKNRRTRKIWKTIGAIVLIIIIVQMILVGLGAISYNNIKRNTDIDVQVEKIIEE